MQFCDEMSNNTSFQRPGAKTATVTPSGLLELIHAEYTCCSYGPNFTQVVTLKSQINVCISYAYKIVHVGLCLVIAICKSYYIYEESAFKCYPVVI